VTRAARRLPTAQIRPDLESWAKVVKAAGAKLD
jgi:hypothetical protein